MKENLTVSDSKALFHQHFPYVIPSLYKRVVDELLVELNLLNHQSEFNQDAYFCVGLRETFEKFTTGYEPINHLEKLFNALCTSTNFDPEQINSICQETKNEHKDKSLDETLNKIIDKSPEKLYYSRILILGIFKIISSANDFKDEEDISKLSIIGKIAEGLKLPLSRAEKDISFYKSNLKRLEQARALLKETIEAEREKRKK